MGERKISRGWTLVNLGSICSLMGKSSRGEEGRGRKKVHLASSITPDNLPLAFEGIHTYNAAIMAVLAKSRSRISLLSVQIKKLVYKNIRIVAQDGFRVKAIC